MNEDKKRGFRLLTLLKVGHLHKSVSLGVDLHLRLLRLFGAVRVGIKSKAWVFQPV